LLKLHEIPPDDTGRFMEISGDEDTVALQLMFHQRDTGPRDFVEIDKSLLVLVFPGKRQQIIDNRGNALSFLDDSGKQFGLLAAFFGIIEQQLGKIYDAVDRIVDLVGDAGGQFADSGKLSGADGINLALLVLGEFSGDKQEMTALSILFLDRYNRQRILSAKTRQTGILDTGRAGLDKFFERALDMRPAPAVDNLADTVPEDILAIPA